MGYRSEFIQALERTKQYKLELQDFIIEKSICQILHSANIQKLVEFLHANVYSYSIEKVGGHCIIHNFNFIDEIARILNTDIMLTCGYIQAGERNYFYQSESDIAEQLINGEFKKGHNLHVWLTLPSLEVIDITLFASFIYKGFSIEGVTDYRGAMISTEVQLNSSILKHKPQFAGIDFLYKIGAAKDIEM